MTDSEIDWSKAPEDAQYCFHPYFYPYFYKIENEAVYFWDAVSAEWIKSNYPSETARRFTRRPISANQEVSTKFEIVDCTKTKPPLGLTPKSIWEEQTQQQRRKDIHAAMQRYIEAGKEIPNGWLGELIELNNVLIMIETDFTEAIQSLPEGTKIKEWIEWGKNEKPNISADAILELEYVDGDLRRGSVEDWTWNEGSDNIENLTVARYRVLYSREE